MQPRSPLGVCLHQQSCQGSFWEVRNEVSKQHCDAGRHPTGSPVPACARLSVVPPAPHTHTPSSSSSRLMAQPCHRTQPRGYARLCEACKLWHGSDQPGTPLLGKIPVATEEHGEKNSIGHLTYSILDFH